ncbi:MAG TPA: MMPL family transporter, partial [Thermomicrobiales bacterium]|nr:MMPL family transporter [Thermomicrobiales bacterium]
MKGNPLSPQRLAARSARHPWLTIVGWVLIAVIVTALGGMTDQKDYTEDFTSKPDSQVGANLIDEHFGEQKHADETLYFHSDAYTVDDPEFKQVVDGTLANLDGFKDDLAAVVNYYDAPESPQAQQMVGADGHSLLVHLAFKEDWGAYEGERAGDYRDAIVSSRAEGFDVYSVGDLSSAEIGDIAAEDMSKDISIGMPVAAVVLVIVFGALIAAGIPLLLGALTIMAGLGLAQVLGGAVYIDDTATSVMTMIGLAVGIDYALFYLERYREERRHGAPKVDAIERAGATAGKAVLFSGGTVLLALLGLLFMPITIFQGMGIGTALTVVIAVAAALTLLPALVRLIGDWINVPRFGIMRKLKTQDRTGYAQFEDEQRGKGLWGHVANGVMRRPVLSIVLAGGFMLLCAMPVLTMQLGQSGVESLPDSDFKRGAQLIAQDFYAGVDDPVRIVLAGDANTPADADALVAAVKQDDQYGTASITTSPDNAITVVDVPTVADPYSQDGLDAVGHLKSDIVPSIFGDREGNVYVAGSPAANMDFNTELNDNLPKVFAFVLGLSFVLLLLAFRSVVVPLMSIVLNLLSVGAAYGVVVAVFQHGWFTDMLGLTQVEVIANWLPVMLFCILFGLSMDYHVFLLSRIREHWDHTGDNEASVAAGVQSTGRIITGAALIMVAVFTAFAMGRLAEMQQMGLGLGIAVLLDATLIRTILVPATMRVLGRANWYMPRALNWLPNMNVEGNLTPIRLPRM